MTMKLGIKVGTIELNFEGTVEIFEAKAEATFKELLELGQSTFNQTSRMPNAPSAGSIVAQKNGMVPTMTVRSVAAKLSVNSCLELAVAAFVSLIVVGGKETVTRHQLIEEMKLATGFYKASYTGGNLTRSLDGLIKKGTIVEVGADTFALKDSARSELESKLAQQ